MVEGLIRMMNSDDDFVGPVNLGNPEEITILELAKLVIELTQSHSEIQFLPPVTDDPKQRRPDISLAQKRLKWRPRWKLRDGLIQTIKYFKRLKTKGLI
jgi:UDP-glucuronate decarboxylase